MQADSLPDESQRKPKNTGVGSLVLLQRIFPTQGSNWGLVHWLQVDSLPTEPSGKATNIFKIHKSNKMLSKICSSYFDKHTFIMTWKDRSEFRILTPWHSTQEKGSEKKAGPACLPPWPPPTPETQTPEVWPLDPAHPNAIHTLCKHPPHTHTIVSS